MDLVAELPRFRNGLSLQNIFCLKKRNTLHNSSLLVTLRDTALYHLNLEHLW